jgi:hypothetical protein
VLRIATQNDMTATSAVAAIRSTFLYEFFPVKMQKTCSTVARPGAKFYIVYEVWR